GDQALPDMLEPLLSLLFVLGPVLLNLLEPLVLLQLTQQPLDCSVKSGVRILSIQLMQSLYEQAPLTRRNFLFGELPQAQEHGPANGYVGLRFQPIENDADIDS